MNVINSFDGEYDFLSNFYECPILWKGNLYRNSESIYQSYKTLDNVIKSIVNNVNYEIVNAVGSPFRDEITEDWYLKLFYTVEDNKDFLKLMFNAEFKYRYLEMINELVLHNINNISLEEKNYRLLWAGGIVNRIIQWIDDELLESPEELASFCYSNFKKNNI